MKPRRIEVSIDEIVLAGPAATHAAQIRAQVAKELASRMDVRSADERPAAERYASEHAAVERPAFERLSERIGSAVAAGIAARTKRAGKGES